MSYKYQHPWDFDIRVEEIKTVESDLIVPRLAIIRKDTNKVLGVVSDRYQLVHNKTLVEKFEEYLKDTDTRFRRLFVGSTARGNKFYAKYLFPDISVDFGMTQTAYGEVPDNVVMMMEVFNSYDGNTSYGFDFGGYRLVCLNGLRVYDSLVRFKGLHVGKDVEIEDLQILSFETIKELFIKKATSWKKMKETDFDAALAGKITQALELTSYYEKKFNEVLERQQQLKTMWDFYNVITWFTTHLVERRNFALAQQLSKKAFNIIAEEVT